MSGEAGEKTEEPTDKKLSDARREGNVWKSKDLSGLLSFTAAMAAVKVTWDGVETRVRHLFAFSIEHLAHPVDLPTATSEAIVLGVTSMLAISLPVALAAGLAGGLADFLQVGALLAPKAVMPKLDKLNPVEGLKNLFSAKQLVELVKSTFKLSVTAVVVYGVVRDAMGLVVATIRGDAAITLQVMGELIWRVTTRVVLLLTAFAIFDVWYQRRTWLKGLRMSKQEVKKEYKESEGDPHHKAKRKELHQELAEGAQLQAVQGADVVITNPDHLAVALAYRRELDQAPRVVAKGANLRAEAIRGLARDGFVPLLRNVPLAHALFRVEVGEEIPEALYDAVAEVLNFVYQLRAAPPGGPVLASNAPRGR